MTSPTRFASGRSSSRGLMDVWAISKPPSMSVVHPCITLLQPAQADHRNQADHQEEDPDKRHRFDIAVIAVGYALGLVHQFQNGDGREQRRLLEHRDEIIGERR